MSNPEDRCPRLFCALVAHAATHQSATVPHALARSMLTCEPWGPRDRYIRRALAARHERRLVIAALLAELRCMNEQLENEG